MKGPNVNMFFVNNVLLTNLKEKIRNSPIASKIVSNSSWSLLAALSLRGLRLLAVILLARIFDKQTYGEFGIIQSSIVTFTTLAALGMGVTASRFIGGYKRTDKVLVGRVITMSFLSTIVMGSLLALVLYWNASWVASSVLSAPNLSGALRIGAFILLIEACVGVQVGVLTGFQSFRSMAFINIFTGLLSLILIVVGARYSGLDGALWGMLASATVGMFLNSWIVYRNMSENMVAITLRLTRNEYGVFRDFSFPALMAGLLIAPVLWMGNAMLVKQPNGYLDMAVLNIAFQWFSILLFLPGIVTNAVLPLLAEANTGHGGESLQKTLIISWKLIGLLLLPLLLVIAIISPLIMAAYGPSYADDWPILVVITVAVFLASSQNLLGNLLAVNDQMWRHFGTNLIWAISYLLLAVATIENEMGAMGLAISLLLSYLIKGVVVLYLVRFHMRMDK